MANTNNGYLTSSELDFDSLKQSLQKYMSQQAIFSDWNFEGSNISVLLDLLTYNTSLNALYLNLVGSECFLDSAQLRESIVSHAKELNYVPRSRTSSFVNMNVQLAGNNIPGVVTLPSGFTINGIGLNGTSMQFVSDTVIVLSSENDWSANANFYEGRIITETFLCNTAIGNSSTYSLQSANADISSISVTVQNSLTDSTNSVWSSSTGLVNVNSDDKVWFLQGYKDNYYQLVFGNGIIGKSLVPGNIITVKYRETSGSGGNGISKFTPLSNTGISGVSVVLSNTNSTTLSTGGNERESNNSIQFSAPRFSQSQDRAVTESDYEIIMQNKFPQFQTVCAYGGESAYPQKQYGTVLISGKLVGIDYVPDSVISSVVDYMQSRAPLGITVKFVQPDVYSLMLFFDIIYDPLLTSRSYAEISSLVTNAIITFDASYLNVFGNSLWSSKLENAITDVDPSVLTADFSVYMTKTITIIPKTSRPFSFSYKNSIFYPFSSVQKYPSNYDPAFVSSSFVVSGVLSIFTDDGTGIINLVDANDQTVILIRKAGIIDYVTGDVSINPVVITSADNNEISFYAHLQSEDVKSVSSQILSIDVNKSTINLNTKSND